MGYDDRHYFGQCKLIIENNASTVTITSSRGTWTADTVNYEASVTVPGSNQYTITAGSQTKVVQIGYGQLKRIKMGE